MEGLHLKVIDDDYRDDDGTSGCGGRSSGRSSYGGCGSSSDSGNGSGGIGSSRNAKYVLHMSIISRKSYA